MIEWLTDTLVMTGALMALVLLVRRPVSRWFGPAAAYALWALPVLRLILPPLALPPGIFGRPEISVETVTAAAHPALPVAFEAANGVSPITEGAMAPASVEPDFLVSVPWFQVLVAVWLIGAAVFLLQRIRNYRLMRAELLAGARQVAHAGDIRIVESPAAAAPLAFGVRERIVALPENFLATVDSESSDFAIAHELEHHAGNDLLALMVLQPLFALHWFNPIGWAAWRALRADQEAACDARVMAGCNRDVRARYGRVIASFAAGTRLTLAAPMAGALAGEKPIIQRLKALATLEVSPARRVMARSLFAFAVVAVPCTATVTYAAMEEQGIPEVPQQSAARSASITPSAPAVPVVPEAADAPAAPAPPQPPEAGAEPDARADSWPAPAAPRRIGGLDLPPPPPAPPAPPGPPSYERMEATHRAAAHAEEKAAQAMRNMPQVEQSVTADGKVQTIRIVHRDENGRRRIQQTITIDGTCAADRQRSPGAGRHGSSTHVCTGVPRQAMNAAIRSISSARASVASNRMLATEVRNEIVAELDREMAQARAEMIGEAD